MRDLSCQTGKVAYKTKRDAQAASSSGAAKQCKRCRWWHVDEATRRGGGTRK